MAREKFFMEYPLCFNYEIAVAWLKAGHELWQEIFDDFPSCTSFENLAELEYNFPDKEISRDDKIHLVTKTPEMTELESMSYDNYLDDKNSSQVQMIATMKHLEKYGITAEV